MKIYVAGPYTAATLWQVEVNVQRAIDAGIALIARGHHPYVPHLTQFILLRDERTGAVLAYHHYMDLDLAWLPLCDALLYLGSSPGADVERYEAKQRGLVIYERLEDVPDA